MKITEDCINHNAMRLVEQTAKKLAVVEVYDYPGSDHPNIDGLGYIRGVLDLANELKAVLKV